MKKILALLLICYLSQSPAQLDTSEIDKAEAYDAWVYKSFQPEKLRTKNGIESIGEIIRIESEPYESGHASVPLESRKYYFNGLMICALVPAKDDGRAFVSKVEIKKSAWQLENGLKVGMPATKAEELLSKSSGRFPEFCGLNNCIKLKEKDGAVSEIEVLFYVD